MPCLKLHFLIPRSTSILQRKYQLPHFTDVGGRDIEYSEQSHSKVWLYEQVTTS